MVTPLFKMIETTSTKTHGGARKGSGRKSFDREFEDRRMLCMWLCDWFARQVGNAQRPASDAKCEEMVDGGLPLAKPQFETAKRERSVPGRRWGKARRGERPFGPEEMVAVCAAADKHKFWDLRWRRSLPNTRDDPVTLLLLTLVAAEGGFENQLSEKKEFKRLQTIMVRTLSSLVACTSERAFDNRKTETLEALRDWQDFVDDTAAAPVGLRGGYVYLRHDLLAAEWGEDDPRGWILHPARTAKRIAALRFGGPMDSVELARTQVWSMKYTAHNFSDSQSMMQHIRRLKNGPAAVVSVKLREPNEQNPTADIDDLMSEAAKIETGTKLAQ